MIKDEIVKQLDQLPFDLQKRVLDFAQALVISLPKGVSGKQLLRFSGTLTSEDAEAMSIAIETECEKVDLNEW